MLTSCALSIEFHIILVIVLMTIQVFYISIIFYKLLPMFMIHISFINIALSLFTCFIYQYRFISFFKFHACIFQRSGYGKELCVPKDTIMYERVISICPLLYDPNGAAIMTKTGSMSSTQAGPTISVCCSNCIPNRYVHLSIYLVISRQSFLLCFQYISHIHE